MDLVPARMLNEYVYCARLAHLMWVDGEFADNYFTEDGRYRHRRVDRGEGRLPSPEEWEDEGQTHQIRSVMMSAPGEGLIARIDMVELQTGIAVPVDYKRGKRPLGGVHDPERVQLCAQGLILRENGWTVEGGWIYFVESRERAWVEFDDELIGMTRAYLVEMRESAARGDMPPPLVDSPKCNHCSLNAICLPDELEMLIKGDEPGRVRQLVPARDDALPMYLQAQGLYLGMNGEVLEVRYKGVVQQTARLKDVSQVNLVGNIQVSTQAVRKLCSRGVPICYFSTGGWFYGITHGLWHKNVGLRQKQFSAAADGGRCLEIARRIVAGKVMNCRTLLMRNHADLAVERRQELARYAEAARTADSMESLLGLEGMAARTYFQEFTGMLKQGGLTFSFENRNRRPPRDPINAMLSFAYSLLTKELTVIAQGVGFDPYQGFYHQSKYGKPALALDLMEEFRPIVCDSAVLWAVNNGVIGADDFEGAASGTAMTSKGRRVFIEAFERRLDELVTHPMFGYRVSYRRLLEVQTRLVGRYLEGELPEFPSFRTR